MTRPPVLLFLLPLASLSSLACTKKASREPVDAIALYETNCARCHGMTGGGGPPAAPGSPAPRNFRDHGFQAARTDAELRATIMRGKGASMPPFGTMFTDAQLEALVRHVRSFDGGM